MFGEAWNFTAIRETLEEIQVCVSAKYDVGHFHTESIPDGSELLVFGIVSAHARKDVIVSDFIPTKESIERMVVYPSTWALVKEEVAFSIHKEVIEKFFSSL